MVEDEMKKQSQSCKSSFQAYTQISLQLSGDMAYMAMADASYFETGQ